MKFSKALFCLIFFTSAAMHSQSFVSRKGDSISLRFLVSSGMYFPNLKTSARIDGRTIGTEIVLEDDFNLPQDLGVFRADIDFQLSKKSSLVGSYTFIKRANKKVLKEDVTFKDVTFESGSGVSGYFNIDYVALTYRYHYFNELKWTGGFSAGLRGVFIDTGVAGRLNSSMRSAEVSFTAPALLLGIHGSAYLTPRLLGRYSLEAIYFNYQGTRINILESNASVSWFITKNMGLGLAYSSNNYRVTNIPVETDLNARVNFYFGGLNLFLTARF